MQNRLQVQWFWQLVFCSVSGIQGVCSPPSQHEPSNLPRWGACAEAFSCLSLGHVMFT